ncbi:EF-hand domain-containing family member B-like [Haliotis cracherodii]|uniref:EF-hand domain-containing family member B-like n=1 Tax=Haliotis cracherodii TaxID=6455 RepID=UPI0039EC96E8
MASTTAEASVRFPEIQTRTIYAGKYKDWTPQYRAAGKLTATGDTTELCLKPPEDRPESADVIKRFRASGQPGAGAMRVFYGRARDPHRRWAAEMTHGVSTRPSITSGELVNPHPKSLFQQRLSDRKENIYATHIRAPLGISHDQRPGLPPKLDSRTFTFGIPTELDIGAGGLINPRKTYEEVEKENVVGHDLYIKTHADFEVGERVQRCYTAPSFDPKNRFGIPTPHANDGRHVRQTLKWLHETESEKGSKIVSKRGDDFRERTQPQLGKVHDPIKDTLKVTPDHTFGILLKPDEYGAGDLIHNRAAGSYLRGSDRQQGIVAATRHHLKKMNYHKFHDLLHAFRFYDKDNSGKITMVELRDACFQFNLPVEPELLEQLMDTCDVNRDGQIDYVEFCNFLNWKDKMDSGFGEKTEDAPAVSDSQVVEDKDLVPKSPQSQDSTPRRLQKQVDKAIGGHRTSANMINAVVGGVSTRDYRTYGVPTIRTDRSAPRIRRVDDRTNYGDESNAYGLLNPSVFSQHGVYEKDFLLPRSQQEVRDVFTQVGVHMPGETFESVWRCAADRHPKGHVSLEAFRNVLDDIQAEDIKFENHPMAV